MLVFRSEVSAGCQSALMGDLEVLAAAFFYAINTIRLGVHAKMSALELSTRVMIVSTACTFCWAGYDYATASLDGIEFSYNFWFRVCSWNFYIVVH